MSTDRFTSCAIVITKKDGTVITLGDDSQQDAADQPEGE